MPRGNNEVTPGNELPPGLAPRQELPNHIAACRRVSSASDCLHEQSTLARALLTYGCQGRHDRAGDPENAPSCGPSASINVSPELRQPPRDKDADGLSALEPAATSRRRTASGARPCDSRRAGKARR